MLFLVETANIDYEKQSYYFKTTNILMSTKWYENTEAFNKWYIKIQSLLNPSIPMFTTWGRYTVPVGLCFANTFAHNLSTKRENKNKKYLNDLICHLNCSWSISGCEDSATIKVILHCYLWNDSIFCKNNIMQKLTL